MQRVVRQPRRHPDELLRRPDAVGLVGHLRGDGQRLRRRRRLHPHPSGGTDPGPFTYVQNADCRSVTATSSRCRPTAGATRRADHARRPLRARVGGVGPAQRARSTSPRTTSRSRPASTSTSRRSDPLRAGRLARRRHPVHAQGRRASTTPTSPRTSRAARPTRSSGCAIDHPDVRLRPAGAGSPPTTTNDQAIAVRRQPGPGQGCGQVLPARGHDLRPRLGLLHLDPGRRSHATDPAATPVGGFGKGSGQIWGYDTEQQTLHMLFESPSPEVLDFPTTSRPARAARWSSARTAANDNFLRALTREGELLRHRPEQDRRPELNDEFAGLDLQPRRADAVRQHPGHASGCPSRSGDRGGASASEPARRRSAGLTSVPDGAVIIGVGIDVVDVARFSATLDADAAAARAAVHRRRAAAAAGVAGGPVRGQGGARQGARRAGRAALARRRGAPRRGRPAAPARCTAPWRPGPSCSACARRTCR